MSELTPATDEPRPARPHTRDRGAALALCIPLAAAAVLALLMQTRAPSLLAPLLGPFAGHLYGHRTCTMASTLPLASTLAGALVLLALALHLTMHGPRGRTIARIAIALASIAWSILALLSVVNTLS